MTPRDADRKGPDLVGSRPWQPDRLLALEGARRAIATRFPGVASEGLRYLASGWEFDAYLTSDDWVVRFPRRAHCAELFEHERRVHHLVAQFLPTTVAVPRVELLGEPTAEFPYIFAAHRFIPGIAADRLAPPLLPTLARDLAASFAALHAIPEATARDAGLIASDDFGRSEWFERSLALTSELRGIDAVVDAAIVWLRRQALPPPRYAGPLRLIHNDVTPEHFIVEEATGSLVGIIDWTDAVLDDATHDFVALVPSLGWSFTRDVLRHYPLTLDEGFHERLRFLAQLLSTVWLAEAYEQSADITKHIQWIQRAFAAE